MSARTSARSGFPSLSTAGPVVGVLAAALLGGCSSGGSSQPPQPPETSSTTALPGPVDLTFGVYGSAAEVAGYDDMVRKFNSVSENSEVSVVSWRDRAEAMAELDSGAPLPDVFLVSRRDLAQFQEAEQVQPVDELLDARGIDFGDGYSRDALRAFSVENQLECMPYGISPRVIYYNTDLIDFAKMRSRGLPAPGSDPAAGAEAEPPRFWSFEQFAAAAEFATRPRRGIRGVHIEATLSGLSPFIVSGGGSIFDSDTEPTSLAFSDDGTRAALETTLDLLRETQVTLSPEQLAVEPALEWFKDGKLGMIAGFRDLVPELRLMQGLEFDVMAIPILEGSGTVGDITGLCLSAGTAHTPEAADFLTHALSEESVTAVARSGYLVPANVAVAASDDFLQPGRLPANSRIFSATVRDIYIPPLLTSWTELEEAIAPSLEELLTLPVLPPETIDEITTTIDEQSRLVLSPEEVSASPTG